MLGGFIVVLLRDRIDNTNRLSDAVLRSEPAKLLSPAIFGIALIILMYVLPDGIVGGARRGIRRRRPAGNRPPPHAAGVLTKGTSMRLRRGKRVPRWSRSPRSWRSSLAACGNGRGDDDDSRQRQQHDHRRRRFRQLRHRHRELPHRPEQRRRSPATRSSSGPRSRSRGSTRAFSSILKGEQAYFEYLNAEKGGVEVAGKKYKIELVAKDDAYDGRVRRSRTCSPRSTTTKSSDSSTSSARRTTSRSATTSTRTASRTCSRPRGRRRGATTTTRGCSARSSSRTRWRRRRSCNYLEDNKPDATIAILRADDDFGAVVLRHAEAAHQGHRPHDRRRADVRPRDR